MIYNDSRNAAIKLYRNIKTGWAWATSTFVGNFILAFVATYFFRQLGYEDDANYVFFLTILAVGLWVTESIPPFAVGIFIIAGLLLGFGTDFILPEHTNPVEMYLGTWTSNVIWLLLGGFFLAQGMSVVNLDKKLFSFTYKKFGTRPSKLLMGLMLTTAFGSMVMSNTAITAMMVSSIIPLANRLGKTYAFTRALMVGIPAAATLGGMGTIIGSTPNAIAVGALQEKGFHLTFVDWMIFGLPTALILTWIFWKFLVIKYKLKTLESIEIENVDSEEEIPKRFERNAVLFTLIVTILMWLTEPLHHIPVAATSAIPIVLLTLFQVIKEEHVRKLPWDTLMLVAGGLSLGIAMVDVGLTDIIMGHVASLPLHVVLVVILFALMGVLVSNIMSNTAAASILVPLGLSLSGNWSFSTPLIVALSCSCALLLPVSTPSNAIAYASGMIEQKEFRAGGALMILLGPIFSFATVLLYTFLLNLLG
jgi:solute carrier family 13 (sodium-dependent dicarboxylate transporter), member 2/3/5